MKVIIPVKHSYLNGRTGKFDYYLENREVDIQEKWKEVVLQHDYRPGLLISNLGNIKCINGSPKTVHYDRDGYQRISIKIPPHTPGYDNEREKSTTVGVHRLVAIAFVPNPEPETRTLVLHNNDIRDCNVYLNLRWGTPQMNMDDKKYSGRSRYLKGEEKTDSFFTEDIVHQVCDVVYNQGIHTKKEIIAILGYERMPKDWIYSFKNLIHNIINGHCWKYIRDTYITEDAK